MVYTFNPSLMRQRQMQIQGQPQPRSERVGGCLLSSNLPPTGQEVGSQIEVREKGDLRF